ncbi:MAG: DUF1176 domain-containing protein [Rhizobiales bacterium 65-79]|jgi:hypothetical protein|nr:DUF1176 domain-containing protein [Hyphomicrobiales bacterium]OJU05220.1 MAG: DUF1176 domain-containing protein [Rhizobiales bacterium 65-79]
MARTRLTALTIGFLLLPAAAHAEDAYLDDRSTPEALVRSLYNAIDRHEYARAYSYFSKPPAKDVDAYAKGFADTAHVKLLTGAAGGEGAAGSTYYNLPVAIEAVDKKGGSKVYAGCYTLRLADPTIQADKYDPLHIEKGELKPAKGDLADALPKQCGDGPPPPAKDAVLDKAKSLFATDYVGTCDTSAIGPDTAEPKSWEISFTLASDKEGSPPRKARLFQFACASAAYNQSDVYYFADDSGELRNLQFATPELDVRYENDKPEGKVESVEIIGYTAANRLMNSSYDPETRTISATDKWRGAGDASSSGAWMFRNGDFTLVKYDVDASYDGEVDPKSLIDFQTGP